jgi:hypothetical protein
MPFEALTETLLKSGIAPRRVRRYRAELEDHLAELTEAQHAAGYDGEDAMLRARALLGDDAELAAPWLADPRLKSWTARAPWTVFGLAVPLLAIVLTALPVLALVVTGKALGITGPHGAVAPVWFHGLAAVIIDGSNLFLTPLLALGFAVTAERRRMALHWPLLAATLLILLCAQNCVRFRPDGRMDSLGVGIGMFFHAHKGQQMALPWSAMVVPWLLTLLPVLWLAWRRRGLTLAD